MSIVIPPVDYSGNVKKYACKTIQVKDCKDPPVQNTPYTVFDQEGGVRLVSIVIQHTNTETDDKDIDIIMTIDGTTYTYDSSDVGTILHNKKVGAMWICHAPTQDPTAYPIDIKDLTSSGALFSLSGGDQADAHGKPIEGHEIKLQVKMTSVPGTAQKLYYVATYEKLEEV